MVCEYEAKIGALLGVPPLFIQHEGLLCQGKFLLAESGPMCQYPVRMPM